MARKQNTPEGEWIPVHQEIDGNILTPEKYQGQQLIIKGSTYIVISDNADEGIIKTNGPKIDIYGTDGINKGRHLTAIYRIAAGKLTICYDLTGTHYPKTFSTIGQTSYFLAIFKKATI